MGLTAAELRKRAREDLQEVARRREVVAVTAVSARDEAERVRAAAEAAAAEATNALAAAAVTFGGPEQAERVTGIPANEFRSARRDVTAEKAAEIADALYNVAVTARRRGRKGAGPEQAEEPSPVEVPAQTAPAADGVESERTEPAHV